MNQRIRTRFAPSPTGPLHMGGVRTALYSYLFAKKNNGDFILRIEDTDQNRFVEGAEQYIIDALNWCGISPDEGVGKGGKFEPYRQSQRKPIYRQYAEQLVKSGHAYYAFDTAEELEQLRKNAEAENLPAGKAGRPFSYDASVRSGLNNSLNLKQEETLKRIAEGNHYVIRLKVEAGEEISFTDLIRGKVVFKSDVVDDKVLLKSDGMPTYHLAHIVDDMLMEITHAIRGEEWLPSAPAHILIYKYLGWENKMPHYAHLPLLLKPDGNGKLSKRDGDRLGFPVFPLQWKDPASGEVSTGYREKGYYAEAFVNMLALLGWNPGTEQEIFRLDELIQLFSFEHIHKAGAKFNPDKTKWFNEQWLQKMDDAEIANRLSAQIANSGKDLNYFKKAVALLKPRVQFENEMPEKGKYLFEAPATYDEQVISKKWKPDFKPFFYSLTETFKSLTDFTSANIETTFKETAASNNLKPGEVLQLLRLFISGQGAGVDLFPMLGLLGKEEVVLRLNNALQKF